jgi:hypothetical protein
MIPAGYLLLFLRIIIVVDCATDNLYMDSAAYMPLNFADALLYNSTYTKCVCFAFFSNFSPTYQVLSFFKNNNTCLLFTNPLSRSDIRINTNSEVAYLQPPSYTTTGNFFLYT